MTEFFEFLHRMGLMHDCRVLALNWKPAEQRLEFQIDDLYSNFLGLPDYPGPHAGTIALAGVSDLNIAIGHAEFLNIDEFEPSGGSPDHVSVKFWPSGRITARFASAIFPKCLLPA